MLRQRRNVARQSSGGGGGGVTRERGPRTLEEQFWATYKPPELPNNGYLLAAGIVLAIGLAVFSATLKS